MYRQLEQALQQKESFALATVIKADSAYGDMVGAKVLRTNTGLFSEQISSSLIPKIERHLEEALTQKAIRLCQVDTDCGLTTLLLEPFHPAPQLIVLGGGHVALPLVKIAHLLQYEIIVVDDRPDFANSSRFPNATVICNDFGRALEQLHIGPRTSVVIVTRGHQHDRACLEYVLGFEPSYVGMIGSRRRVKALKELLLEEGYPADKIDRVHMPIGVPINAETPEEIAVSIAAELVAVHRQPGKAMGFLASADQAWEVMGQLLDYIRGSRPVVAATIVGTKGSTPRKAGAKMLIQPDGTCFGTIGGGCSEAEVRRAALRLFDPPLVTAKFHKVMLDADIAADEGMVCGGTMEVFLERLV